MSWVPAINIRWPWGSRSGQQSDSELPVRLTSRDYARAQTTSVSQAGFDSLLFWVLVTLLCWGLIMVYSASIAMPDNPRFRNYSHTHFALRHVIAIGVGTVAALIAYQIPMSRWEKWSPWLFAVTIVLLLVVLIPFIGKGVNGARRWIPLGLLNFQPSELAKFAMVMYAAGYMVRRMEVKERFFKAMTPMGVAVMLVGVLLLAQPDMGAFMVLAIIAMGILFLGGVNLKMFSLVSLTLVGIFLLMITSSPWRRERVFAYLDPFSADHALGKGYQLTHSLIAFGRGEIFGVGLGGSVEKLHWLPEAHTDFLLAVVGEELGFVGVVIIIALFMWMVRRIMQIGRQAIALEKVFSGLVAQGVAIWVGFQAFINIGVNLGALPTKGLTLPFMSYGGSAILMNLVAMAVVLRIDSENRKLMQGGRV